MKRAAIRLGLRLGAGLVLAAGIAAAVIASHTYEDPWGDCDD